MITVSSRTSLQPNSHPALVPITSAAPERRPAPWRQVVGAMAGWCAGALNLFLPARCAGCDRPGVPLCSRCRCALVGATGIGAPAVRQPLSGPRGTLVAMTFTGPVRQIILGLKYRNRRILAGYLAGLLVNRLVQAGVRPGIDIDVVTWAPTSAARRNRRGFDHAHLVARQVAAQLQLPCTRLLQRDGNTGPQTGRGRAARLRGPKFRVSPRANGAQVLVIDDVVTTGATLEAARHALKQAGAARVLISAVAATPSAINDHRSALTPEVMGRIA